MTAPSVLPVFVYGSLKKGHYAHHFLAHAKALGTAITAQAEWDMYPIVSEDTDGAFYPGICRGGAYHICGELYQVNADILTALDDFENQGIDYLRQDVPILHPIYSSAWIYVHIATDFERKDAVREALVHCDNERKQLSWAFTDLSKPL